MPGPVADLDLDLGGPGDVGGGPDVASMAADLGLDLGGPGDVGGGGQADLAAPFVDELVAVLGPEGEVGQAEAVASALSPLEGMWNTRVRRLGDNVGEDKHRTRAHPNTYGMDAAVKEAFLFKRHHQRSIGTVDIDSTHRELEGVCTVACMTHSVYSEAARDQQSALESCTCPLACCVCRYFDGTPSFHDFGSFTGLAKEARYVKEIPAGTGGIPYARFTTMSYDEMVASRGGRLRRLPQRGILEIMSRSAEYAWCCVDPNRPEEQTHAPEGHGSQYLDVHRHHIYILLLS